MSSAAEPATWGEAMLVPLNWAHVPSCAGTDERMLTPGAVTSGLSRSDTGFGPADEKLAILFCLLAAAAVITPGALPGELIDPKPHSSASLPAAIAGTTPAWAAASIAATTMSFAGSISTSPYEKLITSIPSWTAASIPATISGALASRPNCSVGMPPIL